jgi:hypothetical protein
LRDEALTPELVFDASRATSPTARLPLSAVHDPLTVTHAADRIAGYREQMLAGARFPPIAVIRLCGRHLVADGHKRLAAFRTLGLQEIIVEVWPWSRWLADQHRQAVANARKNRRILALCVTRPRDAARLAATTLLHWRRVVVSLLLR